MPMPTPVASAARPMGDAKKTRMIFDGVPRAQLAGLGETGIPGLADLFVATMKGTYT